MRLYWLTPSLLSTVNVFCDSQSNQSRDAKFCVSQARMRNKQVRNMAVITAVFARETQGMHLSPAYHCMRFIAMDCS